MSYTLRVYENPKGLFEPYSLGHAALTVMSLEDATQRVNPKFAREGLAGDEIFAKIVAMLRNPKESCFAAGTEVWTEKGLVPIEQLKVGDLVLSQDEASNVRGYRRITQTFEHEAQPLRHMSLYAGDEMDTINVTANHPVWVVNEGWISVENLQQGNEVLFANGVQGWFWDQMHVYKSGADGLDFWYYDAGKDESWPSTLPEGVSSVRATPGLFEHMYCAEDPEFRTKVYNIEVEDFHTYFVGEYGLWVHNKDPFKVILQNGRSNLPPNDTPVYYQYDGNGGVEGGGGLLR